MLKISIFLLSIYISVEASQLISQGKESFQSSTYNDDYPAAFCNDGIFDNLCYTKNESEEFWNVYLSDYYRVDKIVLYNRVDCCSERIVGAVIQLYTDHIQLPSQCGSIKEVLPKYVFYCNQTLAKKITITQTKQEYLHFRELQVFGELTPSVVTNKPTNQSSTYGTLSSQFCNDGSYANFCHTTNNNIENWTVDLQGLFEIDQIYLINRGDCCRDRIVGAKVEFLSKTNEIIADYGSISSSSSFYVFSCYRKFAEKIRVQHTRKEYLHFAEMIAKGVKSKLISLGKPANQTSTDGPDKVAKNCNDGIFDNLCSTTNQSQQYWIVDLQGLFRIDKIVLYNRVDCCSERIVGVVIELLSKTDEIISECGSVKYPRPKYTFYCRQRNAEKIRIRQTRKEYLHFSELQIFESQYPLISQGKPANQSSIYDNMYEAAFCNDGIFDNFCYTLNKNQEYWIVDLQEMFNIDRIVLYNRVDSNSEKMIGVVIELLQSISDIKSFVCGYIGDVRVQYEFNCILNSAKYIRIRHTKHENIKFHELQAFGIKSLIL